MRPLAPLAFAALLVCTVAHAQVPPPEPPQPSEAAPAPPPPAEVAPAPPPPAAPPPAAPPPAAPPPAAPPPAAPPPAAPPPAAPPPAAAPAAYGPATAAAVADPGVRRHDGFYLRLGLGVGNFSFTADVEQSGTALATVETSTIVPMSELAFGGTVAPGLVLGGGIYTAGTAGGSMDFDITPEGGTSFSEELDTGPFGIVGPFIDYYFNPEQGLHLQAALGLAVFTVSEPSTESVDDVSFSGPGVMLGFGYEWWIGEQWSLGVLGRVMYASLSGEDPSDSEETYSATALAPGLLLSVTYH